MLTRAHRHLSATPRTLSLSTMAILLVVFIGTKSNAAEVAVPDFCFFGDFSTGGNNVSMTSGDNLMIDDGQSPPAVALTSHKMGFITYPAGGGIRVDGCADNPFWDGVLLPGFEGLIAGDYSHTLGDGNKPDDLWIIEDPNDDGLGTFETSSGTWTLGSDDFFYAAEDVFLNGIALSEGGATQLPAYSGTGNPDDLPSMTVYVVPEPEPVPALGPVGIATLLGLLGWIGFSVNRKTASIP